MVGLELRSSEGLEIQLENTVASPFLWSHMSSSVANLSLRRVVATPDSQLLKMGERKDTARCLHFVLPLAEWGLALNVLIKTRDSREF